MAAPFFIIELQTTIFTVISIIFKMSEP